MSRKYQFGSPQKFTSTEEENLSNPWLNLGTSFKQLSIFFFKVQVCFQVITLLGINVIYQELENTESMNLLILTRKLVNKFFIIYSLKKLEKNFFGKIVGIKFVGNKLSEHITDV